LLRLVGSLLLRLEESRFDALLFQLPPRITRFEASLTTPSGPYGRRTAEAYLERPARIQPPNIFPT
jgi:hypothetical protein